MAGVDRLLVQDRVDGLARLAAPGLPRNSGSQPRASSFSPAAAEFERGCHSPRSIASDSRCGDLAQRRRVRLGDEVAHRVVLQNGGVHQVEMVRLHGPGGGGEGEQVVDRRRDLEGALVAVPHDAGQPFRVDDARADDAADLVLERADHRPLGPGVVVVVDDRRPAGQVLDRRRGAALELVVVVRVEQVVLAVVLVLHDRLGVRQPRLQPVARARALGLLRHRRSRPIRDSSRRGRRGRPTAARRSSPAAPPHRRRASSRRPGSPPPRPPPSARQRAAAGFWSAGSSSAITARAAASNSAICAGKASRKKPETRSVTSTRGRASASRRDDLEPGHAPAGRVPGRPHAHQRQPLRDVVAARAHVRRAPGGQHQRAQPVAMRLQMPLDQHLGRLPAQRPGGRRRHGAAVDRVEVAPRRQHVRPPPRRRARRPGRDEPPVEPGQQRRALGRAAGADGRQNVAAAPPPAPPRVARPGRRSLAGHQPAPPAPPAAPPRRRSSDRPRWGVRRLRRRRPSASEGRGEACRSSVADGQVAQCRAVRRRRPGRSRAGPIPGRSRSRAPAPGSARRSPPLPSPRGTRTSATARSRSSPPSGELPEDVQPVADLRLLQLAEIGVEPRQRRRLVHLGRDAGIEVQPLGRDQRPDLAAQQVQPPRVDARRPRNTRRPAPRARFSAP